MPRLIGPPGLSRILTKFIFNHTELTTFKRTELVRIGFHELTSLSHL